MKFWLSQFVALALAWVMLAEPATGLGADGKNKMPEPLSEKENPLLIGSGISTKANSISTRSKKRRQSAGNWHLRSSGTPSSLMIRSLLST